MATQWNYDFSPGDVFTAAATDSLGAPWETFTPSFRPDGGVWFVAGATYARYGRIGKIIFGEALLDITSFGTATGFVTFDLPITAKQGNGQTIGLAREFKVTGNMISVQLTTSSTAVLRTFNNGATANGNFGYGVTFMYEAA
jgi:hypothetical protein